MSPWAPGAHVVQELITTGKLSRLRGADAGVEGLVRCADQQLCRRRNELDYPTGPEDFAEVAEAERALGVAESLVENARRLLDQKVLTTF